MYRPSLQTIAEKTFADRHKQRNLRKFSPPRSFPLYGITSTLCINVCRPPKLFTKTGKVKFHPKSVNSDETTFVNKFMIYYTMVKSSAVFIHDCSMIPPYPLLFFGGDISVLEEDGQEVIAVDHWIKFQAPKKIAELVKVGRPG